MSASATSIVTADSFRQRMRNALCEAFSHPASKSCPCWWSTASSYKRAGKVAAAWWAEGRETRRHIAYMSFPLRAA
jgi:hypothetical protein